MNLSSRGGPRARRSALLSAPPPAPARRYHPSRPRRRHRATITASRSPCRNKILRVGVVPSEAGLTTRYSTRWPAAAGAPNGDESLTQSHDDDYESTQAATADDGHDADPTDGPAEGFDPDATYDVSPPEAGRGGRRWGRWAAGALILLALVAGAFAFSSNQANGDQAAADPAAEETAENAEGEEEKKPPVPVEVATVTTGDVAAYITATTNLVAEGEVEVLSEVDGRVTGVTVDEGDWVRAGQVLASLDRRDAEITLEKTRVREENARSVHQRGLELAKDELISAEDLDKRRLDFELARQERAEAERSLAKTTVTAPIAGRLSLRTAQPGQHVKPGDPMFRITDSDPLVARIYLPEKDVLRLATGRSVDMSLDAAPEVAFTGRIRQISPVVDTATGTVKVTVEAESPPAKVRPGSFVTVRVVRERRGDTVVLPREAVLRELKQAHVFVATGEGEEMRAERRAVTLGLEESERVEALSGIEPGERVIVAGQGSLSDGAAIRTLDLSEQAALADYEAEAGDESRAG